MIVIVDDGYDFFRIMQKHTTGPVQWFPSMNGVKEFCKDQNPDKIYIDFVGTNLTASEWIIRAMTQKVVIMSSIDDTRDFLPDTLKKLEFQNKDTVMSKLKELENGKSAI